MAFVCFLFFLSFFFSASYRSFWRFLLPVGTLFVVVLLTLIPSSLWRRRSLILCHSKTSDDFPEPEERTWGAGDGVPGPAGPWGPGGDPVIPGQMGGPSWAMDPAQGPLTVKGQPSSPGTQRGTESPKHPYPHSEDLREHKRSLRRTFSIKVRRDYFFPSANAIKYSPPPLSSFAAPVNVRCARLLIATCCV